ncbi:MAG: MATE family efflux transporter [Erysipelotrichia bacterium]|nr:MATE family efflux transporter [Erysipelotrichia bacterium]
MKNIDILNSKISIVLINLSLPVLLCGVIQQLYNMTDLIIVGHFVDGEGIAIVGSSAALLYTLITNFAGGMIVGPMVVIGKCYGQHNEERTKKAICSSYLLIGLMALVFTLIYLIAAPLLLKSVNIPDTLFNDSTVYLRLYSLGYIFYFIFLLSTSILRVLGLAKLPTTLIISSFILNIILDIIFIIIYPLGYKGVCCSYILTQVISAVIALKAVWNHQNINLRDFKADQSCIKEIIKTGLPAGLGSFAFALTNNYIQSYINLLNDDWISGFAIYTKLENTFWVIMTCLMSATTTFVSQNYGAKQYKRVFSGVKVALFISYLATFTVSAVIFFGSDILSELFINNIAISSKAAQIMRFMAPTYFLYTAIEIFSALFQSTNHPACTLNINLVSVCLVRYLWLSQIASTNLNYQTISLCWPVSWILTSSAYIIYYLYLKKKEYSKLSA